MISKYEFLLKMAMIGKSKLIYFKKMNQIFTEGLPDHIDCDHLLNKLNLSSEQKRLFNNIPQQPIDKTIAWLTSQKQSYPCNMIAYGDKDYPALLKQICSPPCLLFIKGNLNLLHSAQIAMVGSREFSEYGAQWGRYFANELAINGMTITSGLALGIDAICHRGALDVAGNTLAVLGSGIANIMPRTNLQLAKDILESKGAIISEFLPFESARPEYFPRRNRIISGLSLGTFIIEASEKSGSLITARYALEQNRDVFALPGEINNTNCEGTHWLIKQGAYLVTHPTDILEHYSTYLSQIKQQHNTSHCEKNVILYPEIFAVIHHKPIPVDLIAEQVELPISEVTTKLLDMELEGLIKTVTGGYIRNIRI